MFMFVSVLVSILWVFGVVGMIFFTLCCTLIRRLMVLALRIPSSNIYLLPNQTHKRLDELG